MDDKGSHKVRVIKVIPADGKATLPPLRADTKKVIEKEIIAENKRSKVFAYKPPIKNRSRSVPSDRAFKEVQFQFAREQSLPRAREEKYSDSSDNLSDSSEDELEDLEDDITKTTARAKEVHAVDLNTHSDEEKEKESLEASSIKEASCIKEADTTNKNTITKTKNMIYFSYSLSYPTSIVDVDTSTKAANKNADTKKKVPKEKQVLKKEKEASNSKDSDEGSEKKKKRKLPCCFGFIATWIAKRKEKRREKKRKAIASRVPTPTLVQYEHKKARGGESFVIEVDCKPLVMKPKLPPIKEAYGPIRLGTDARLEKAEQRRLEELSKKKTLARDHEGKKNECKRRKDNADHQFRERVRLSIQSKQADAERSRSRMQTNRASISRMSTRVSRSLAISSSEESVADEGQKNALKVGSHH